MNVSKAKIQNVFDYPVMGKKLQICRFLSFKTIAFNFKFENIVCDGGRIARRVVLASNFCRGNDAAGQVQNLWWTFATKHGRAEEEDCQLLPPTAPRVPTRNPSKNQAFLLSSWRFPPWFSQWFQVCLSLTERFSTLSGQKMWSLETINQKFWCGNSSSNSLKILAFSGGWYLNKY